MTIHDKIRDEELSYINREEVKTSASLDKIDKYEYLTGDEILPSDQSRKIEQAKFAYSPLGKAFEKQKQLKGYEENKFKQMKIMENNWLNVIILTLTKFV